MPPHRTIAFLLGMCVVLTGFGSRNAKAAPGDVVDTALSREIIGPRQTLADVMAYCEPAIPQMPEVKTVAEWEAHAARMRSQALNQVIFRGEAAAWRDAKTRVEWLETIEGGP